MKQFYFACIAMLFLCHFGHAQIPNGYYDPANGLTGDQLKAELHNIIDGHITFPYSSSSTDTWDILKEADRDPNNPDNVIGIYSGFSMNGPAEYDNGNGWNREHVWAKSRGDLGTTQGPGTDLHHIRVEDVSTNSERANKNFDNADFYYVDGSGQYSGATLSKTSSTEWIWEPRDAVKGDVARMIFYMVVRYEGINGEPDLELTDTYLSPTSSEPLHSKLSTLVEWHLLDPVDDSERNRNEVIYSYQQNRNPFIDHPEFVCLLFPDNCSNAPANSAPQFTSTPLTDAQEGQLYTYNIDATDVDGDNLSFASSTIPGWLTLSDNGDGTAILSGTPSISGVGSLTITITVNDGSTSIDQSFTLTVVPNTGSGGNSTELFFSEYIEGSSYNKGLELANFTGSAITLTDYTIQKQTNGAGDWGSPLTLSGTLGSGEVYVIVHANAANEMQLQADLSSGTGLMSFNGNDAIGLFKNNVLIDVIGVFNSTAAFGQDVTLVRKSSISQPNTAYTTTEWDQSGSDTFTNLGSHTFEGGATSPAPCEAPSAITTSSIFTGSADISWNSYSGANSYTLEWRVAGSGSWNNQITSSLAYNLTGLLSSTNYDVQVASICGTESSTFISTSFTTAEEPICDIPSGLSTSNISQNEASLNWNSGTTAISNTIRYKIAGSSTWTSISGAYSPYTLTGLSDGTNYEFQVKSECGSLTSGYSASAVFSTLPGIITYCPSNGKVADEEWIERFSLANIDNTSGNNGGYADFTSLVADVRTGNSYSFTITPAWSGRSYYEAYDVWIDFNQNGDFNDAGEHVALIARSKNTQVSGTISIPSGASTGTTRMRVSMKYNQNASSCESFSYGEVEDYNISITGISNARSTAVEAVELVSKKQAISSLVFPNPTSQRITIDMEVRNSAFVELINLAGQAVLSQQFVEGEQMIINIKGLKEGVYLLTIKEEGNYHTSRIIIE